jgi:hypothetical protein
MTLDEIMQAIAKLPPEERAKLRAWLAQHDASSEPPSPPDTPAEKLGRLAGRAFADIRKRMRDT